MADRLVMSLEGTDRGIWATTADDMIVWQVAASAGFGSMFNFTVIVSPAMGCSVVV